MEILNIIKDFINNKKINMYEYNSLFKEGYYLKLKEFIDKSINFSKKCNI